MTFFLLQVLVKQKGLASSQLKVSQFHIYFQDETTLKLKVVRSSIIFSNEEFVGAISVLKSLKAREGGRGGYSRILAIWGCAAQMGYFFTKNP